MAWKDVSHGPRPALPAPFNYGSSSSTSDAPKARVSVLIPTLERYPYLRTLLDQLRSQTVRPYEIIVVDQTSAAEQGRGSGQGLQRPALKDHLSGSEGTVFVQEHRLESGAR